MTFRWFVGLMALATPLLARAADPAMLSDPYAKDPQSTLSSWPPLYHLPPGHKAFYYQMGWCGEQFHGKRYDEWYRNNALLNVNAMPETSLEGEIVEVTGTYLTAREPGGQTMTIVLHRSPTVTDLHMVGSTATDALARGVWTRFVGIVDHEGRVTAPVSQVEIYTPRPGDEQLQVVPDQHQVIAGRLLAKGATAWELKPARRSRFNAVEFTLANDARLTLDVAQFELAKPGQKISVRGRLFEVAAQLQELAKQAEPDFFTQIGMVPDASAQPAAPTVGPEDPKARSLRPVIFACRTTIELSSRPNPPVARPSSASAASNSAVK